MTKIFKTKSDFYNRTDRSVNGVSVLFAENNSNWKEMNETNEGCWNCSNCSDCLNCSDCSNCSDCCNCSNLSKYRNKKEDKELVTPVVENLHQKIYEFASQPSALQMDNWHTNEKIEAGSHCGTTHCRAGWIVALAGKEGRDLEIQTSTIFAAMQINKVSSEIRISPKSFYLSNDLAMKEMKIFAQKEKELYS